VDDVVAFVAPLKDDTSPPSLHALEILLAL
jgi:hypothetical protein